MHSAQSTDPSVSPPALIDLPVAEQSATRRSRGSRRAVANSGIHCAVVVSLSGAVPLKALQDKARCVVDMSTDGPRAGASLETAAWSKGRDIGYIGESLQITCPRRSSRPSSTTSRTPSRWLQILCRSRALRASVLNPIQSSRVITHLREDVLGDLASVSR